MNTTQYQSIIKSFETICTYLKKRNYDFTYTDLDYKLLFENISNENIVLQGLKKNKYHCFVFIAPLDIPRYNMKTIENVFFKCEEVNINKELDTVILISERGITPHVRKNEMNKVSNKVEIWTIDELQIDKTKHVLIPKHRKLKKYEIEEVCKKHKTSIDKFPILKSTDVITKIYGWKEGNVIEINRKLPFIEPYPYYRKIE